MELKRCKQCGLLKDAEAFRQYTYSRNKGTQGRYSICRECESINQTYRRAKQHCIEHHIDEHTASYATSAKDAALWAQVCQIEQLYDMLRTRGLKVPEPIVAPSKSTPVEAMVKRLSDFYAASDQPLPPTGQSTVAVNTNGLPDDLAGWLNSDWHQWQEQGMSPEYLQETVYESLKAKYRPQTGFDRETGLPIYDDTYKTTLNEILRRFDDYEEAVADIEEAGGEA